MATYIALIDYTDQGIRSIKESPKRSRAFNEMATRAGVTVHELYWTSGEHDGVLILESDDDKAVTALLLGLVQSGNVRTTTLRAYGQSEMQEILATIP